MVLVLHAVQENNNVLKITAASAIREKNWGVQVGRGR